jgi:predicted 3-demethylubiquinone-9 3-methyltransferase (glyoxalase superfamily)
MSKITPCLWFNGRVAEALDFYQSVFPDSEVLSPSHYTEAGPGEPGDILTAVIRLNNQEIMLLNGGPDFALTEAVSLVIDCADQAEVDYYWNALLQGGAESQCGWLTDQFGLSWQIVPSILGELVSSGDAAQAERVMQAVLGMVKLDIAGLQAAYDGT